jgi:hypothetical protein
LTLGFITENVGARPCAPCRSIEQWRRHVGAETALWRVSYPALVAIGDDEEAMLDEE